MRAVVQRVKQSSVKVNGNIVGEIGRGLLVLLGVANGDSTADADFMVNKIVHLRIFEDENGKMNRSLQDVGGEMLVVSHRHLSMQRGPNRRRSCMNISQKKPANRELRSKPGSFVL
jgi:D-tyrosyl-tRNA(Tyr) deacylase